MTKSCTLCLKLAQMIEFLSLTNLPAGSPIPSHTAKDAFVIKTCQRSLVLEHGVNKALTDIHGPDAYFYLLEVICGLQSKLIGENEIVGQFKKAYHQYIELENRNAKLMKILEKLFKDAKEIRRKYLLGICQKTYASITRRSIMSINNDQQPVVILGSGNLAEDLINQFKKKTNVIICARNQDKVRELAKSHDFQVIPWDEKQKIAQYAFIANTVGTEKILFDHDFFHQWTQNHQSRLFVDLASPSPLQTHLEIKDGVMHLEDVFKEGAIRESKKRDQIATAKEAIKEITLKRHRLFKEKVLSDERYKSYGYEPVCHL